MVQWLRLDASTGLIPGQRIKIPQTVAKNK